MNGIATIVLTGEERQEKGEKEALISGTCAK